jgi:hypothetical protein
MVEAEACIPLAAAAAFASASKRVLESGDSVLLAEDDVLYEVFPDGMRKRIKPIQASVVVKAGERIRIVNHQTDPSGRNSR